MLTTQGILKEILLRENIVTPEGLNRAIKEQERSGEELSRILLRLKLVATDQLSAVLEEVSMITLTNTVIQQALAAKASDVFIEPMENCLRIRYRIDGQVREIDRMSQNLHFPLISRIKDISRLDIAEHRLVQDGRFRMVTDQNKEVDFRVNVLPTTRGEKIVLSVLDKDQDRQDMDKLGFEPQALDRLKECCQKPHGMILACGPAGSGKTTTLCAIVKYISSLGRDIVTVEDLEALRSILRQDPDVILIDELQDSKVLNIAVKAALTGHLVLSSMHTTTGPGSITRMVHMGVEPFLITSSVAVLVAQRLVRRVCPQCRELYTPGDEIVKEFHLKELLPNHNGQFYRPRGCTQCFNTGYKGRLGISEALVLTDKIKELILSSSSEADIKKAARGQGMTTMREDAIIKASQGLTTLEEVICLTLPD